MHVCRTVADNGCAVVLVTHKLAEIKQVADIVTVLRQGRTVARSMAPAQEIGKARERHGPARSPPRSTSRSPASIGVEEIARHHEQAERRRERGEEVLQVDGLTVRDKTGVVRVDNVTPDRSIAMDIEIVGVAGVEGNGQTEIGLVLAGLLAPTEGRVFIGGQEATGKSPGEITVWGPA